MCCVQFLRYLGRSQTCTVTLSDLRFCPPLMRSFWHLKSPGTLQALKIKACMPPARQCVQKASTRAHRGESTSRVATTLASMILLPYSLRKAVSSTCRCHPLAHCWVFLYLLYFFWKNDSVDGMPIWPLALQLTSPPVARAESTKDVLALSGKHFGTYQTFSIDGKQGRKATLAHHERTYR